MVPRPPSVDALATTIDEGGLPRALLVEVARQAIAASRDAGAPDSAESEARRRLTALARTRPGRVINATGVLLHTNLGRAPISADAVQASGVIAAGYSALEFDLERGVRGGRGAYATALLNSLTGAGDALVVNNNAGALLLSLAALGGGAEVIVSRGELIEIGGSFRLPDLMGHSGAVLKEVGTTNRTRVADYRKALGPKTAAILKVHPSNYRIEGFTEEARYADLATVAAEAEVPFIADLGSGLLDARTPWLEGSPPEWLAAEPAVRQTVATGASVTLFSGDKLLGGPQAGIAVGDPDSIDTMRRHPVARALRIAAPELAALTTTLEQYASGRGSEIPFWALASIPSGVLRRRCDALASAIEGARVEDDRSLPGAGSVPGQGIPGPVVRIAGAGEVAWQRLLDADPPVIARRDGDELVLDPRAVTDDDDAHVAEATAAACR